MKKIITLFIFSLTLFVFTIIFSALFFELDSREIVSAQEKVIYQLPYPGLLPDHPLYFFKAVRDRLIDLSTRDYLKKASLYLLYADKRINMGIKLIEKGKYKLALETILKAEKYFFRIPDLILNSKSQGVDSPPEFVEKVKVSHQKHEEIINVLIKEVPAGYQDKINQILKINQEIKDIN